MNITFYFNVFRDLIPIFSIVLKGKNKTGLPTFLRLAYPQQPVRHSSSYLFLCLLNCEQQSKFKQMEHLRFGRDDVGDRILLDSIFPVFEIFFEFSLTKVRLTVVELDVEVDFSEELGLLFSDRDNFCFPGVLMGLGVDGFA